MKSYTLWENKIALFLSRVLSRQLQVKRIRRVLRVFMLWFKVRIIIKEDETRVC